MKYSLYAVAAALTISTAAVAQTQKLQTQVTPSTLETISKYIGVNYFGVATGPGLGELNSPTSTLHSTDNTGSPSQMNLYNELRIDGKSSNRFNLRLNHRFNVYPLKEAAIAAEKGPFVLQNFRYGVIGRIVDPTVNGFSVGSSIHLELPTSVASQQAHMLVAPRISLQPNFDVPNSRWSLGAFLTGQTYLYGSFNTSDKDLYFYFGPYANYRISNSVQATFQIDAESQHTKDTGLDLGKFTPGTTDFQLGVNWDVSSKFSINPYIQIYPDNVQLRTSFIGANISATML